MTIIRVDQRTGIIIQMELLIQDINWFKNEENFRNAVLGHIWAEHRISFGVVTPDTFEMLKQNRFFLDACNFLRTMRYDQIQLRMVTLHRLKTQLDN